MVARFAASRHEAGGYLTAQSRSSVAEALGYVFDHYRVTAEPGVGNVYLGRPWRDYATVTFVDAEIGATHRSGGLVGVAQGRDEPAEDGSYAEFRSSGTGANAAAREPYSKQLTADDAKGYAARIYLAERMAGIRRRYRSLRGKEKRLRGFAPPSRLGSNFR